MCAESVTARHDGCVRATIAVLVLVVSGSAATGASSPSGLHGLVLRGPVRPVCSETEPCDTPAAGVTLVFSRAGGIVARTRTGPEGRFRVVLRPGRYAVRTTRSGFERIVQPGTVTVPAGPSARIVFRIDTGIR
jgi:hypothetical protein